MILSLELTWCAQISTRLWIHSPTGWFHCLDCIQIWITDRILIDFGFNSSSRSTKYILGKYPLQGGNLGGPISSSQVQMSFPSAVHCFTSEKLSFPSQYVTDEVLIESLEVFNAEVKINSICCFQSWNCSWSLLSWVQSNFGPISSSTFLSWLWHFTSSVSLRPHIWKFILNVHSSGCSV